ncbi:MAG: hypothetical protein V2B20_19440 [Pseudomonadota bacterium]
MTSQSPIKIGVYSWKYDSWQGLVYSDQKEIEEQTGNDWSEIVVPQNGDLQSLAAMLADLQARNVETFLFVNNFRGVGTENDSKDI